MDAKSLELIPPFLITGCARSGTSMTAGIIHQGGAWGGELSGPTIYNKKGMFENAEIRSLQKLYLTSIGADPLGQKPLPIRSKIRSVDRWAPEIRRIVTEQGYMEGPWFYKGAKMCLIWELWAEAFPDAKWVIVRRNDKEIIDSCMRTGFMKKYTTREGWQYWIDYHKQRFQEMKDAGLQIKEVYPIKFVQKNYIEIKEVIEWLGLEWKESFTKEFVNPSYYNQGDE